ncbi:MAG: LPXTG cell wall anchor domain-containing protein [Clostridiales bacterium]|nr:LPXTG cell wall anchor domain-containing protein [Clostridiales bacterium]
MAALSAVVVFVTTYMLILPAITMENQALICGMEEHVHTEDCYQSVLVCEEGQDGQETSGYICGQEEAEGHTHDDSCCGLTCGLEETEGHVHDDSCYESEEVLTCDLEECDGHSHGDSCYNEEGELTCGEDESDGHTHDESCYTQEEHLVCGQEECEGHTHDDSCYGLICGKKETEGHTHDDSCLPEQPEEETEPAEEHVHTEDCYQTVLVCGMEEHTHTEECYAPASEVNGGAAQPENPGITDTAFPQEIPEGYVEYNFDDEDGLSVTAYAPEDAFGGQEVELVAQRLAEDSEDYAKAQQELDEADDVTYDGFAALDVRFEDGDGKEIEPEGTVYVRFNVQALLPADVDEDTLSVQHHGEETTKLLGIITTGTETYVQTVADSSDSTGEVIAQLAQEPMLALAADEPELEGEETEPAQQPTVLMDVQAEFAVDSFSTFTITWTSESGWYDHPVTVHYVDTDGVEIEGDQKKDVSKSNGEMVALSDFAKEITGYRYEGAHLNGFKGTPATKISCSRPIASKWQWKYQDKDGKENTLSKSIDSVYLVYEKLPPSAIEISDANFDKTGNLTIKINDSTQIKEGGVVVYEWLKNGEVVTRKAVTQVNDKNLYNLSEDTKELNVALDKGAQASYQVRVKTINGVSPETEIISPVYQVPYYDSIQNGSFENPNCVKLGDNQPFVDGGGQEIVWQTTASDNKIEMVSVYKDKYTDHVTPTQKHHKMTEAADGVQFVELNANEESSLYQDVLTIPGSTMYWQVAHAARIGHGSGMFSTAYSDEMYVVVMSTNQAATLSKNQAQLVKVADALAKAKDGEVVTVDGVSYAGATCTLFSNNTATWKYQTGEYEVPEGQYLTRYFFVSKDAMANHDNSVSAYKNTIGNHIDDVSFSTDMPKPKDDEATLTIQKTIEGLSGEELVQAKANLTFKVTIDGEETEVKINNWNDNVGTWQKTVKIPVNTTTGVTYTVSEVLESAKIDGYTVTSVITKEGTESGTLSGKDEQRVEFRNTYDLVKIPGSLSITKTVVRTDNGDITNQGFTFNLTSDPALNDNYTAEVKKGEAVVENRTVTFTNGVANITLKHGETITINGIPQDTQITVTETNTDGYAVSWDNGGVSHTNATTVTIPRGATAAITCTNTTGAVLPSTGGAGTAHIMSVGAALTLAAGALLLLKRRKEARGAN